MATEIPTIERSILTPVQNVQSGNAFAQMGQAAGQISELISNKLNDYAAIQATKQAAQDVEQGKQPKELAPALNKVTKAYNDSVSNIEARRMVISAEQQIQEALLRDTNPATFNNQTPTKFKSTLDGIIQGTIETTRPENREAVTEALMQMGNQASIKMLGHAISYDNNKNKKDFTHDVSGLLNVMRNASISGDAQIYQGASDALEQTLKDYAGINEEIKLIEPDVRNEIEKSKQVDKVIGDFNRLQTSNEKNKYLYDYMQNKEKLPYDVWQKGVQELFKLSSTEKQLSNDYNAVEFAQAKGGIDNGTITTPEAFQDYPSLTVLQQMNLQSHLNNTLAQRAKSQKKLLDAQRDILSGRSAMISSDTKNELFKGAIERQEQATGQIATLPDMEQMILGTSQFPVSGLPNTPLGTNVPKFDAQVSAQLTSKSPLSVMQAGMVYNDMVNVRQQPNSIDIKGEALSVAALFNTLNNGSIPPEQAAELASKTVLDASEPEMQGRLQRFNHTYRVDPRTGKSKLQSIYKEMFGTNPKDFDTDASYKTFETIYRTHYLNSNSEEAAKNATKEELWTWGTSRYFEKGFVGQPVPEKELPELTNAGYAFDNQIKVRMQLLIDSNKQLREAGVPVQAIEWADKSQVINLKSLTDEDRVFKPLGIDLEKLNLGIFKGVSQVVGVEQAVPADMVKKMPQIKVDGRLTDTVLVPAFDSRLGQNPRWTIGYFDKFNNLQILQDPQNRTTGVAQVEAIPLNQWAPAVLDEQNQGRMKETAEKIRQNQIQQVMNNAKDDSFLKRVVRSEFGLTALNTLLQRLNAESEAMTTDEIMEQMRTRQDKQAEADRALSSFAENIGVKSE